MGHLDELDPARVVAEDVADDEFATGGFRLGDDPFGGCDGFGEGFFDEDVATSLQGCDGIRGVGVRVG